MNILIVDDHIAIRSHLQKILEKNGYETQTAINGQDALDKANANPPDLIFMDLQMPVLDGFEAIKRLKRSRQTAHIPVIIITAVDNQVDENLGLVLGADAYIKKPVIVEDLLRLVEAYNEKG